MAIKRINTIKKLTNVHKFSEAAVAIFN